MAQLREVAGPDAPIGAVREYQLNLNGLTGRDGCLAFYTVHQCVEVYIGGELVAQWLWLDLPQLIFGGLALLVGLVFLAVFLYLLSPLSFFIIAHRGSISSILPVAESFADINRKTLDFYALLRYYIRRRWF